MRAGNFVSLIFLAVPLLLVYMLVGRTRRQQRSQAAVQEAIGPGQRVMTTSGLHGVVVSVDDRDVVLEIAPGVHTRWIKLAIGQVLEPTDDDDDLIDDDDDVPTTDNGVTDHALSDHPDDRTLT